MAIKVTTPEKPEQEYKPFPKLMIIEKGQNAGTIIAFRGEGCGSIIKGCGNLKGSEFKSSESWDMEQFTDYNDPITIQNA